MLRRRRFSIFTAVIFVTSCWMFFLNDNDDLELRTHVMPVDGKIKKEQIRHLNKGNQKEQYMNVLLLGYARGGSTYVGEILGHSKDSFYFYEPLFVPGKSLVYHHNDSECQINSLYCRPFRRHYLRRLRSVFACHPPTFNVMTWQKMHGGLAWRKFGFSKKTVNILGKICKKSQTRVAKVLRMSAESVEVLIKEDPSLKVVYLYRDPRGIVNSRLKARFIKPHWKTAIKSVKQAADGLCHKMEIDSSIMFRLKNKYQHQTFFFSYEKIVENPKRAVAEMFSALRKHVSEEYLNKVAKMGKQTLSSDKNYNSALRSNGTAVAHQWKKELSAEEIKDIDQSCAHVYKRLGYTTSYGGIS